MNEHDRFHLVIAPTEGRQLSETLPESVASAAYEFIVGALLDRPRPTRRTSEVGLLSSAHGR